MPAAAASGLRNLLGKFPGGSLLLPESQHPSQAVTVRDLGSVCCLWDAKLAKIKPKAGGTPLQLLGFAWCEAASSTAQSPDGHAEGTSAEAVQIAGAQHEMPATGHETSGSIFAWENKQA